MGDKTHTLDTRLRCGGRVSLWIFQTHNSHHPHSTHTPTFCLWFSSFLSKKKLSSLFIHHEDEKHFWEYKKLSENEEIFEFFNENLFGKGTCVFLSFFSWLMIKTKSGMGLKIWGCTHKLFVDKRNIFCANKWQKKV